MTSTSPLVEVLERARTLGVLGPGPVADHIVHADRFVQALSGLPEGSQVVDLGSGGGIPGLVIAERCPHLQVVLLDAMARRTTLLVEAVARLGWEERVSVVLARAEDAGRDAVMRGAFDAVTARSFGPPATVAECAAPLLRVEGLLIVSEPPDQPDRWSVEGLEPLGLRPERTTIGGLQVLRQFERCPERFPRRVGVPAKRPLF